MMEPRTRDEASYDKRNALREAEAAGEVADNMDARGEILRRIKAGEITLEQGQAELKKLKRGAKKKGQRTRNQVWHQS